MKEKTGRREEERRRRRAATQTFPVACIGPPSNRQKLTLRFVSSVT
jgi:hypothetical protein